MFRINYTVWHISTPLYTVPPAQAFITKYTFISMQASWKNVGNTEQAVHDHKRTMRGWTQQAYQIGIAPSASPIMM
jgi:hypothetical protein